MLNKLHNLIKPNKSKTISSPPVIIQPIDDALLRQLVELRRTDPMAGLKLGSKELSQRILKAVQQGQKVHYSSALCAMGAVAGYACQASVRALAVAKGLHETAFLIILQAKGTKEPYYFGDKLDKPFTDDKYSLWGIVAAGVQNAGGDTSLDLKEIFHHTKTSIGKDDFGIPRLVEGYMPQQLPIDYVKTLWPGLKPLVATFCPNPEQWPMLIGLCIQEFILKNQDTIDPHLALRIVMESAIPMSRVHLATL
jgi:hypothetical protein